MKRIGVFLLPPDGVLVLHRFTTNIKFAGTHLYTWVERGTGETELCSSRTQLNEPRRWPGPLNPQASAPCISPAPWLHFISVPKQHTLEAIYLCRIRLYLTRGAQQQLPRQMQEMTLTIVFFGQPCLNNNSIKMKNC